MKRKNSWAQQAAPLLFIVALLALGSPAFASEPWRAALTLETALETAAKDQTLVVIDVFATWCGPCKQLDRETFSDPRADALLSKMVALKIDGESGPGEQLVETYNVVGYPTVLFIGPDGREVDRVFGFVDANTFVDMASAYAEGRDTLEALRAALEADPTNLELRKKVFFKHVLRGDETDALKQAEILRAQAPDDQELWAELQFDLGKYLYLRGRKDYALARTYFEVLLQRLPDSSWSQSALYPYARALNGDGQEAKAIAMLEGYVATSAEADKAGAYNTAAWFSFKNDVRPQWGVEMAQKGLVLAPNDAALWDTLAELQFKLGQVEAAVESEQKAAGLDEDSYYDEQIAKFQGGL